MVSSDAITRDYMSIILVTQYGLMLNRSGDVARVQDEMSRVWLAGVRTRKNKKCCFYIMKGILSMNPTILVTGASGGTQGATGNHVTRLLREKAFRFEPLFIKSMSDQFRFRRWEPKCSPAIS